MSGLLSAAAGCSLGYEASAQVVLQVARFPQVLRGADQRFVACATVAPPRLPEASKQKACESLEVTGQRMLISGVLPMLRNQFRKVEGSKRGLLPATHEEPVDCTAASRTETCA